MAALRTGSIHLRWAFLLRYAISEGTARSLKEVPFVLSCCSACLPPSSLEWVTPELALGLSSLPNPAWTLRTGSLLRLYMTACTSS